MSTLRVTVEKLVIRPHPNADALELAQVGLYSAVVPKGVYATGDYALYIPEQAVLPAGLIEELGLTGRLAGSGKDRVKAIRLRGELSQGIVCRPTALKALWDTAHTWNEDPVLLPEDFAEDLGIVKWVPPVPVHMAGEVLSAPDLLPWIDIENIARYPDIFTPGEQVVATEKIHGTCCLVTYRTADDDVLVSSKGQGGKNLALRESDGNLYWRAVKAYRVGEAAREIAAILSAEAVGIFGEVFGKGVQDLAYGDDATKAPGYAVFDVSWRDATGLHWVDPEGVRMLMENVGVSLPLVPELYAGPYDEAFLLGLAVGRETVSGTSAHMREGIVVRPARGRRSEVTGGRAIGKMVSPEYLTRKGATEYE